MTSAKILKVSQHYSILRPCQESLAYILLSCSKSPCRDDTLAWTLKCAFQLAEPDRQEILQETKTQEKTLDAIGDALDDMRRMGQASLKLE